jgi:hypothetical protein
MPFNREAPDATRDWLLLGYAFSQFLKCIEFILSVGVFPFLSDSYNCIEIITGVSTFAACLLNVCNRQVWPIQYFVTLNEDGEPMAPESLFESMAYVWEWCPNAEIAPLSGREFLALSSSLRWVNLIPRLTQRSVTVGPIILSLRMMLIDVLVWLVLLLWLILSFGSFFRALHAEPYGQATDLPDGCLKCVLMRLTPTHQLFALFSIVELYC